MGDRVKVKYSKMKEVEEENGGGEEKCFERRLIHINKMERGGVESA